MTRLHNQPAKQKCLPQGHFVLLQAQIKLANLFSYFIFLEFEIKIFFSKYLHIKKIPKAELLHRQLHSARALSVSGPGRPLSPV